MTVEFYTYNVYMYIYMDVWNVKVIDNLQNNVIVILMGVLSIKNDVIMILLGHFMIGRGELFL